MNRVAGASLPARAESAERRSALRLVIVLGIVSLFADMTYEGARSINGSYLAVLGATGTVVGIVAGGGELIGYALRFWSGRLVDRTQRYWPILFIGFAVNLLAVPALALTGHWQAAAALMVLERVGKAIRTPARDVMLSYATTHTGRGWGFGLHEAMDQAGATIGPLIIAAVLAWRGDYRLGFAVLLIPALAALAVLAVGRYLYPRPQDLEAAAKPVSTRGFSRAFWSYLIGTCLVGAAYADYPLLAFHFERSGSVPAEWIAIFYAIAMGVDGVAALVLGRWFDRRGISVLIGATAVSSMFAPLAFAGGFELALASAVVWGIGMGAQESIMRAAIAEMTPVERRGTGFGLFNMAFGVAWFAGSALMGWLYDVSIPTLIAFSVVFQLASLPFFFVAQRLRARASP
ncbi:MAG TPA: MFS transporter [Burkholderiaceae bacterium]|nr:MFS transporter [Burkholderiaceae bacterium]HQR70935.1 MFS transporter [Burkholderiaceae bacterium]